MCPKPVRERCYTTLIRPILEYAAPVWDPHSAKHINQLEMVQRRSARYVMHEYRRESSVTSMLQQLQWDSLQKRRQQARIVMFYRIIHQLAHVDSGRYLTPTPMSNTRGHDARYAVPYSTILAHSNSYFPRTIRLWNQLPQEVVHAQSLQACKTGLGNVDMGRY